LEDHVPGAGVLVRLCPADGYRRLRRGAARTGAERAPGVQRPPSGLRAPAGRRCRGAGRAVPAAAGGRGALPRPGRSPHARGHGHDPPAAGHTAHHRLRAGARETVGGDRDSPQRAGPERAGDGPVQAVAEVLAEQIRADRLVHVFGPGGHSNLAAQEVFFRAGGLMHISAILDGGTLLSDGALRSMAMERTPGYGRVVVEDWQLGGQDVLLLVNAYGINAALIDAALTAAEAGVRTVGVSSRRHAEATAADHPARHP